MMPLRITDFELRNEKLHTRKVRSAECEVRNNKTIHRQGAKVSRFFENSLKGLSRFPSRPEPVIEWYNRGRLRGSAAIVLQFFWILSSVSCLLISPSFADEALSLSGRLDLRGVERQDRDSVQENPDLEGRIKLDALGSEWQFHSWLEGGWDGTVKRPPRDHALFKTYDEVYQSNTPYLEFKEFYVTHSSGPFDLRAGIQRFAWGRLDEYPPNDLLNPWDYTQFLRKPLEDRKIGVPSVSAAMNAGDWTYEAAWVPVFVPYRLPMLDERWAGTSAASTLSQAVPNSKIVQQEPELPARTIDNSSVGMRVRRAGDIEWALDLFHGIDPRPVFKTTALTVIPQGSSILIDPGYVPDFHRISVIGMDAAVVRGDLSIRAEAAYTFNRYLNIRRELWGYPSVPAPGVFPLNPIEQKRNTIEYGIGADYRLFEDALLTMQAQQTVILGNTDLMYSKNVETLLWANVKIGWMNQKIETKASVAYNPEHGDAMTNVNAWYVFSDSLKAGVTWLKLGGPEQSMFGNYARNDQVEGELVYSW